MDVPAVPVIGNLSLSGLQISPQRANHGLASVPLSEEIKYRSLYAEAQEELRRKQKMWTSSVETLTETYKRELEAERKSQGFVVQQLETKFAELKVALKSTKQKVAQLRQERDEARASYEELRARFAVMESQGDEQEGELAELRRAKSELSLQLNEREQKAKHLVHQREARDVELARQKDVLDDQAKTIVDLHALINNHKELIAKQKSDLEHLLGKASANAETISGLRHELSKLKQLSDKQTDVIARQRDELLSVQSRIDDEKLRTARAIEIESQARESLRVSEAKRAQVEKKLVRLATELRAKHPLTYVPLCRTCRKYRLQNESLKRTVVALKERIHARTEPPAWRLGSSSAAAASLSEREAAATVRPLTAGASVASSSAGHKRLSNGVAGADLVDLDLLDYEPIAGPSAGSAASASRSSPSRFRAAGEPLDLYAD